MTPQQMMQLMMMKQAMQTQAQPGQTPAAAGMPPATPTPGVPGAGQESDTLASILGSVTGVGTPHRTPMPATTFPEAARSMNPQISQMVLQTLMGGQQGPQLSSLQSILAGR